MKSKLYKLVRSNIIIAEGSKKAMERLQETTPNSFVGIGSPMSTIGWVWDSNQPLAKSNIIP